MTAYCCASITSREPSSFVNEEVYHFVTAYGEPWATVRHRFGSWKKPSTGFHAMSNWLPRRLT